MRPRGLIGRCARRSTRRTISDSETKALDLLQRDLDPDTIKVDRTEVSDITVNSQPEMARYAMKSPPRMTATAVKPGRTALRRSSRPMLPRPPRRTALAFARTSA